MLLTTTSGATIHLATDMDSLVVNRYTKFNKYLLHYLNVGAEGEAIRSHMARLAMFMDGKKIESAQLEFSNLVGAIRNAANSYRADLLAVASLVTRINETTCSDMSEEGLLKTVMLLEEADLTQGQVREVLDQMGKSTAS